MPHNHRQDITLYKLFGEATNARLIIEPGFTQELHEYVFGSALLGGEFTLSNKRLIESARFEFEPITFNGLPLKWSDVHTIVAKPEDREKGQYEDLPTIHTPVTYLTIMIGIVIWLT